MKNFSIASKISTAIFVAVLAFSVFRTTASVLPSQGPSSGSNFSNQSSGSGNYNWINTSNATSSDNHYATSDILSSTHETDYLKVKGFGFSIPTGAVINGIVVAVEKKQSCIDSDPPCTSNITDYVVRLVKNDSITGNNKAATTTSWGSSDAVVNYGATNDLWGATWSAADINNANFGVDFAAKRSSGGDRRAYVDQIQVTVYYTLPAPVLTVTKVVVNDNGGAKVVSDFPLFVNGGQVTSGQANTFSIGTSTVTETSDTGYSATFSGDCNSSGQVSLNYGDHKNCILTNDDKPATITVNKVVINNSGGTLTAGDFPLFVNGVQVTNGVPTTVNAGAKVVTENGSTGYFGSYSGDCDNQGNVTLGLGEVKTCTITNDDIEPSLTVNKTVINNNGGNLQVSDFHFFVDETEVFNGVKNLFLAGSHVVSETPVFGYQGTFGGQCESDGSITLGLAEDKICNIVNDDIPPTITVRKVVVNDNGGTMTVQDFPLFLDENQVVSDNVTQVNAGTHYVTETNKNGYVGTFSGDCDSQGKIVVSIGQEKVCTITNNDIPGTLTVNKVVINDGKGADRGTGQVGDFPLFVNEVRVTSGEPVSVNAGWIHVSESNQEGYSATFSGDCTNDGLAIGLGETKTCTITNDDIPIDICPNLEGMQEVLPEGYQLTDGGCLLIPQPEVVRGCTNQSASNYNPQANQDDGSCQVPGAVVLPGSVGLGGNGPLTGGLVLGESTSTEGATVTGGACSALLDKPMGLGKNNDPEEVKKLQKFLNDYEGEKLPISGTFGNLTLQAVKRFQLKYADKILSPWLPFGLSSLQTPTGYVYKTTLWWINMMVCPSLGLPIPQLP